VPPQAEQLNKIRELIEEIWHASSAWPEFIEAMHFPFNKLTGKDNLDSAIWSALPGYCCQAAGGQAELAEPVAAAWLLFYLAAHLMDDLEDQDDPDPWWKGLGTGAAINVATGLYFSASLALQELSSLPLDTQTVRQVSLLVLQPFLVMCSGQHQDLVGPPPTLEGYWRIAGAKSGEFFAIACQAGARLATDREDTLQGFQQFGYNFGLLLQVLDDLKDFQDLSQGEHTMDARALSRSLPAVYVRQVCSAPARDHFNEYLLQADNDPKAVASLIQIIEENGGTLYLLMELEKYRDLALAGLDLANVKGQPRQALVTLLDQLYTPLS
jgi:competence protein ComQ